MVSSWTTEEINNILLQLNTMKLPFEKYSFSKCDGTLVLLGTGGYANVYEAEVLKRNKKYAIKVIGFGEKHVDSQEFNESVNAQKDLSTFQSNIVKIHDSSEIRVWINSDNTIIKAEKISSTTEKEGNYLDLQFILMDKVSPVISFDKNRRPKLYPEALARFEEKEICKLAFDIGTALLNAHEKKLLHRDVKLENIFYDSKTKHYKLGDFGIAKVTDDGMASTIAFTKGYGAPEVVSGLDDRYDNTADIYSFGMLIYILLNGLKFPDSDNYNVNVGLQYQQGYVLPMPEYEYLGLCGIVANMCAFNPDERYQTMDTMLDDLESVMANDDGIRYKKEHKMSTFILGTILLFLGSITLGLISPTIIKQNFTIPTLIVLVAGVTKGVFKHLKKDIIFISLIIFGMGIYLLLATGFTWWKLLLWFMLTFSSGDTALHFSGAVLLMKSAGYMAMELHGYQMISDNYLYVPTVLFALSVILLLQYLVLVERDPLWNKIYFKRNLYWIVVTVLFIGIYNIGRILRNGIPPVYIKIYGIKMASIFQSMRLDYVGIIGIVFSVIWIIREAYLRKKERQY